MKVAVISANLGSFEMPLQHPPQSVKCDFFTFTDDNFPPRFNAFKPRLQARVVKMFAWQLVPDYDYYIWIDSSCSLTGPDSVKLFLEQCKGADVVVFKHPNRSSIQEEADYLKYRLSIDCDYIKPRYENELIDEQMAEIKADKDFVDDKLFASTAMVFRNTEQVREMFKEWWYHTSRYHSIDQLSLPYVLAKSVLKVKVLPVKYSNSPYITYVRNKKMQIHVYSIMWNEEYLLPYFLRHYETFADKIFIINDHSTDRTVEIAKAHPKVELLEFPYKRGLNEEDFSNCFVESYKKHSRGVADWVMCVDADEIIYNSNMRATLEAQRKKGLRVLKCTGYQMISKEKPSGDGQIYDECNRGERSRGYDKPVIFDPALDVTFGDGRHTIHAPKGTAVGWAKLSLLHYKYLSRDFYIERSKIVYPRTSGMTKEIIDYRLKRALKQYDHALKNPQELKKVV